MLKYQVRTLGRERRRQSVPLRDVFAESCHRSTHQHGQEDTGEDKDQLLNIQTKVTSGQWQDVVRCRGRSTSVSSLSSASTSSDVGQEWATIRIYTRSVRPDTEYKTFFASTNTTSEELIRMVLNKFRVHLNDSQLFYLTMELSTKHETSQVRHDVVLDPGAKPMVLQACYPADRCRFVLQIRQSYPVRIYESCFATPTVHYRNVLISQKTTGAEAVRLLMQNRNTTMIASELAFAIALINARNGNERLVHPEESLFAALYDSGDWSEHQLHLRAVTRTKVDGHSASGTLSRTRHRRKSPLVHPEDDLDVFRENFEKIL